MSQNLTYLTTTNELNSVANAIRAKGGTSAQLEYPQGFIDAIDDIETGGGSVTPACGIVPTEYYDTMQSINGYGYYGLVKKAKVYSNDGNLPSGFMCNQQTGNYQGVGQYGCVEDVD